MSEYFWLLCIKIAYMLVLHIIGWSSVLYKFHNIIYLYRLISHVACCEMLADPESPSFQNSPSIPFHQGAVLTQLHLQCWSAHSFGLCFGLLHDQWQGTELLAHGMLHLKPWPLWKGDMADPGAPFVKEEIVAELFVSDKL